MHVLTSILFKEKCLIREICHVFGVYPKHLRSYTGPTATTPSLINEPIKPVAGVLSNGGQDFNV